MPPNLLNPLTLLTIISVFISMFRVSNGVRCFCTEDHCTYGVCESPWCLVGIKNSGPVIRTCGNEAARMLQICRRRVGEWLEVCACDTPYCNTFAFLRHQIKHNRFAPSARHEEEADSMVGAAVDSPTDIREFANKIMNSEQGREHLLGGGDSDARDGFEFTVPEAPVLQYQRKPEHFEQRKDGVEGGGDGEVSYLIIVLIIVPLTVGATAVFLVSLNYYCSLC